ncbi:GDSL-type esterase/lipase family protein [Candidatus Gracilibacteria bacterium]|nr:GDSL-type esterase/lipase family protein [Candidatus Gracilibacteria bacterium]
MANILLFGDSITWGAFDDEKGGWVDRLKVDFMKNIDNEWNLVYNLGIPGDISSNLVKRFESETIFRDGEIVIVAIGINDSCFIQGYDINLVSREEFAKNLSKIYEISLKLRLQKLIFVGLTQVNETLVNPYPESSTGKSYKNKFIREYDEIIEKFCSENNLGYIDLKNLIKIDELPDGIHPNSVGHEKIFEKVKKSLVK